MTIAQPRAPEGRFRAWLADPAPASVAQARIKFVVTGAMHLLRNPLAAVGLAIVALLIVTAVFAPLVTDGVYGSETKAAIKFVQGAHGLYKDGLYGPDTADVFKSYVHIGGGSYTCRNASW